MKAIDTDRPLSSWKVPTLEIQRIYLMEMDLYLPCSYTRLSFSQERSSEAEYLAMWSFGLMQLFHFVASVITKSLDPVASQKASQRPWALDRHPEQLMPS